MKTILFLSPFDGTGYTLKVRMSKSKIFYCFGVEIKEIKEIMVNTRTIKVIKNEMFNKSTKPFFEVAIVTQRIKKH